MVDAVKRRFKTVEISAEKLKESVHELFQTVSTAFQAADEEITGLELQEIEVNAAISVSGKLTLIAGEIQGGYQGSITFKFKRPQ